MSYDATEALSTKILDDLDIIKGKILSVETEQYLRVIYTELTVAAAEVNLNPTPEERQHGELLRAFDGGKRAFILELLEGSESAKAEIKLLNN